MELGAGGTSPVSELIDLCLTSGDPGVTLKGPLEFVWDNPNKNLGIAAI